MAFNRRSLLVAGAGLTVTPRVGLAAPALNSQMIGLTRSEIEAIWGPLEGQIDSSRLYPWDMYFIGTQKLAIYVAFADAGKPEESVVFAEADAVGDGLDWATANELLRTLIPDDVTDVESYELPPTPNGPIAINCYRYSSRSLAESPNGLGPGEILVTLQEVWSEEENAEPRLVKSIAIAVRSVGQ